MNIKKNNKLIIISSPSGAGKTTLCKMLIKRVKNIKLSVSYTSRSKRLNEINGKDYFFVTKEKFNELKNKNFFIETTKNFNNFYGSPIINTNKNFHLLFDIDWKGARKIRKNFDNKHIIDIFILPPSKKELKKRLLKRGRENNKEINLRLSYALKEMKHFNEYKYVLVNENIQKTIKDIIKIIEFSTFLTQTEENLKKFYKFL